MNTILLPTDFSPASLNAGKYAIGFAKQIQAKKVILYHTYSAPINFTVAPVESAFISQDLVDFEMMKDNAQLALNTFKERLDIDSNPGIEVELMANFGFFTEDIKNVITDVKADIVIMGISGGGSFTENIIGSDTVVVARQSSVPVIIVPSKNQFKGVRKVVLISDFIDIKNTVPTAQIKKVLDETNASLIVLHIIKHNEIVFDSSSEEHKLFNEIFDGYNPRFFSLETQVFADGVNEFIELNEVDLVIVIPKKHNLIESLFIKSHTKELAFHSHCPLLIVHS